MRIVQLVVYLIFFLLISSCQQNDTNYYSLSAISANGHIQAVIEIPAGTNHKIEYSPEKNTFPVDIKNGEERIVQFLPYPGNYGFIPSTMMDKAKGGDGDALDVLIIAESVPTKTVMEIIPIAVLKLSDGGEVDDKIIAIPADKSKQLIHTTTYQDFIKEHLMIQQIIQNWFLFYKGKGVMEVKGWADEKVAKQEIEKWIINK